MNRIQTVLRWISEHRLPGRGIVVSSREPRVYPEVTGYLVPTLFALGEKRTAAEFAVALKSLQTRDGGFKDPAETAEFSFDTGQALRGLVAAAEMDASFVGPTRKAAEWLIRNASSGGRLLVPDPAAWSMGARGTIDEAVHLYCLPPLVRAADLLGEPAWRKFATESRDRYIKTSETWNFARKNQLSHLFCYIQEALCDLGAHDLAARGMAQLAARQDAFGTVPAYADVAWVCTPGQFQAAITWMKLGDHARAQRAIEAMFSFQNGSGGFFGSYGVGADYFDRAEISWAAKFALDALLLEMLGQRTARPTKEAPLATPPAVEPAAATISPAASPIKIAPPVALSSPRPSGPTEPSPSPVPIGKVLDRNLLPDEWHESITSGAEIDALAKSVVETEGPVWIDPVLDVSQKGDAVLEFGSGTGELSARLARAGRRVTLCDFSQKSLDFARSLFAKLGLDGEFVRGDVLERLPLADKSYDVVWSSGLLEHFSDADIKKIVDESARLARRRVVSLVPNASSLPYRLGKWIQEASGRWIWGKEDPKVSLRDVFAAAGLSNIREYSIAPEHALNFLDAPELAAMKSVFAKFFETLTAAERASLNQGYLLVTIGDATPIEKKTPSPDLDKKIAAARDALGGMAPSTAVPQFSAEILQRSADKNPPTSASPADSRKRTKGRGRTLVILPNDPLIAYRDAGYPDLTEYFNPARTFDEVVCVSPHETREYEMYGARVVPTPISEFARRVREVGADVVRAYDLPAGRIACAQKLPGVPVIVSVHDTDPERCPGRLPAADLFLPVSAACEDFLLERGANKQKIRRFANRVDMETFRPIVDAAKLAAFKERFPGKYRVLLVGRRMRQKNIDGVLRALAYLGPDFAGIFVGRGEVEPYRRIAADLGITDRCSFIDSVPNAELAEFYSFADCMCTPSRWEGFGIVFIEALACEAVVVTSDIGPMNEYVKDGVSGLLVKDYEDPVSIAFTIQRACVDSRLRAQLKSNARAAAEPFSRQSVVELERTIYEDVLRGALEHVESGPGFECGGRSPSDADNEPSSTSLFSDDPDESDVERTVQAGGTGAADHRISTISHPQGIREKRRVAPQATAMNAKPRLHLLSRDLAGEWERIVSSSPDAWLYHTFAEQVLLEEAWKGLSMSFLLEWKGKLVAVCPLQRWRWDMATLHSTMMGTGGPAIAGDVDPLDRPAIQSAMYEILRELVDGRSIKKLQINLPPLSKTSRAEWSNPTNPLTTFGFKDRSTVTSVIDLSADEDVIFSRFCADYRNRIRKAERESVEIFRADGETAVDDYYRLHVETYRRTGVQPHPREYFASIFNRLVKADMAHWFMAKRDGKILGAMNLATYADASLYWTGAYSVEGLRSGAGKLLQWHAIKFAKSRGLLFHETGEVFPNAVDTKEAGLTQYKRRFGGEIVPFRKGTFERSPEDAT